MTATAAFSSTARFRDTKGRMCSFSVVINVFHARVEALNFQANAALEINVFCTAELFRLCDPNNEAFVRVFAWSGELLLLKVNLVITQHDDGYGRIEESEFYEFIEESVTQSRRREGRSKVRKCAAKSMVVSG